MLSVKSHNESDWFTFEQPWTVEYWNELNDPYVEDYPFHRIYDPEFDDWRYRQYA